MGSALKEAKADICGLQLVVAHVATSCKYSAFPIHSDAEEKAIKSADLCSSVHDGVTAISGHCTYPLHDTTCISLDRSVRSSQLPEACQLRPGIEGLSMQWLAKERQADRKQN